MLNRPFFLLFAIPSLGFAAPTYNQLFGGPGPTTNTDNQFVLLGNTAFESFGYELSFNAGQRARVNGLNSSGTFVFSAVSADTPAWVKGRTYTITESYSGDVTKKVNTSLRDTVTGTTYNLPEYTASFGNVKSLIVRMVAPDPDLTGSTPRPTAGSLTFSNWVLQGQPIAGMPSTLVNSTVDTPNVDDFRKINYFSISGIDFTQAWTLSGDFQMDWSGSTNPGSNANPLPNTNDLAFQIKAYQKDLVNSPEPQTTALFGVGLAVLGVVSRRRRAA